MGRGFKVFDKNLKCRGFQYEIGKTYHHKGGIQLCGKGFHFSQKLVDCFNYYSFVPENRVCIVEYSGDVIHSEEKSVCSIITVEKELSWEEVIAAVNSGEYNTGYCNSGDYNTGTCNTGNCNSGYYNTGDFNSGTCNTGEYNSGNYNSGNCNTGYYNIGNCNSGNYNTGNYNSGNYNSGDYNTGNYNSGNCNKGYYNSGYYNSGNYNTGDFNTGNYNSGDYNTGYLCTDTPGVRIFNTQTSLSRGDILFPNFFKIKTTIFIKEDEMTDEEKQLHPDYSALGGYFKSIPYKEAWRQSWDKADKEDKYSVMKLPHWDNAIFKEITGIDVELELNTHTKRGANN